MNAPSMIESLEPRQLLSAWTTIGDFSGAGASLKNAIAADGAGNVFVAAGPVVRERLSGGSGWTTILDSPTFDGARLASFYALAMDPARNLYAGGVGIDASGNQSWVVLERPVSATGFSMIDDFQGDPFQQGFAEISEAYISGFAVDAFDREEVIDRRIHQRVEVVVAGLFELLRPLGGHLVPRRPGQELHF